MLLGLHKKHTNWHGLEKPLCQDYDVPDVLHHIEKETDNIWCTVRTLGNSLKYFKKKVLLYNNSVENFINKHLITMGTFLKYFTFNSLQLGSLLKVNI